ncbi:MAG: ABC transporter ATP-binding protein [Proteobacteria bacterium]|nr:ABC transporter ATP-binding protein [Pseudomonadota bacterium]
MSAVTGDSQERAVQCRGLTKSFGTGEARVPALRGLDLDIDYGEMAMLVGPSGCGKTTLLSIIAAVLDHDTGLCRVLGRDLKKLTVADKVLLRRQAIGFVFQAFNLIPTLTLADNVSVPLLLNGVGHAIARKRAGAMLDRLGLGNRVDALPSELSGGQQQRVAIARALVHGPRLVVCDEPTSALDAKTGDAVLHLLREVALEENRTLIIVTHDSRILKYADRIIEMSDGVIMQSGTSQSPVPDTRSNLP